MATAIDDAPLGIDEKIFQKFFSMAKKAAKKSQPDSREPIYLTPDDFRDMGETLQRAGKKLVEVAEEMQRQGVTRMLQKAKQLKNTWVPWIIDFAAESMTDIEGAAYAERRGVPSPKESNRLRYLRAKERQAKSQ